jgi:hypothetical protein
MYIPELSRQTYRAHGNDGFEYRSVGWLADQVTDPGDTDPYLVAVLGHLWNVNQLPDNSSEAHRCEVCAPDSSPAVDIEAHPGVSRRGAQVKSAQGEFFVEDGSTRYVLPNLVLHYLLAHRYKLPEVVEAALLKSAPFTREDWEEATRARAAQDEARAQQALRQAREDGLTEGHQSGLAEGLVKGELEGRRRALVYLLERAGIALTYGDRARIEACADQATLDRWLDRVIGARTVAAVFSGP